MTDMEKRTVAAKFAAEWQGRGDKKQETSLFWISLLQKVYGLRNSTNILPLRFLLN